MKLYRLLFTILLIQTGKLFSQQPQTTLPSPSHIVIAILENHSYTEIIGSSAAPNINVLASDPFSAVFTQSFAIEHPSQPNYLDLYSGCNQGVTDDNVPSILPFTTANLGKQLINAGKTFITYSEDLPSVGFNGAASGSYARKHNPAANWMGTGTNQVPPATNQPFTAFPSDFTLLPSVCYVVPNQDNDMHNGTDPSTITTGDAWIYNNLNAYIQWAKTNNSLFILTFDEDDKSQSNQITTIFTGQMVLAGQYTETIDHYTVLRTIEDMYGLPYACNASASSPITDCWINPTGMNENNFEESSISVYPNPTSGKIYIHTEQIERIELCNVMGQTILTCAFPSSYIDISDLNDGIYILKATRNNKTFVKKIIKQ